MKSNLVCCESLTPTVSQIILTTKWMCNHFFHRPAELKWTELNKLSTELRSPTVCWTNIKWPCRALTSDLSVQLNCRVSERQKCKIKVWKIKWHRMRYEVNSPQFRVAESVIYHTISHRLVFFFICLTFFLVPAAVSLLFSCFYLLCWWFMSLHTKQRQANQPTRNIHQKSA